MKIYYPPQKTLHCYNLVISHTSDQSQLSTFCKSIYNDKKLDILEKNLSLSFVNKYIHLVILYKNHISTASWYEAKQGEDIQIVGYKSQWLSNLYYVHFTAKADKHKTITFKKILEVCPHENFLNVHTHLRLLTVNHTSFV